MDNPRVVLRVILENEWHCPRALRQLALVDKEPLREVSETRHSLKISNEFHKVDQTRSTVYRNHS